MTAIAEDITVVTDGRREKIIASQWDVADPLSRAAAKHIAWEWGPNLHRESDLL